MMDQVSVERMPASGFICMLARACYIRALRLIFGCNNTLITVVLFLKERR
jgi:hypothetical protein